ncbi:iron chelate uptake ABC transporter family permease subunit, partial [Cronobacter sakazakii]
MKSQLASLSLCIHTQRRRERRVLTGLALALVLAVMVSLCAGDVWLWPAAWSADAGKLFVWQIRLPRTIAVVLVGAALALCG